MKPVPTILMILLALSGRSYSQQGINYKAIINDANGTILVNTPVTIHFTILHDGTTEVYQESHNPTTDANGIIIVNIGEGTPIDGAFDAIDWGSAPQFLKTEIDTGEGLTDMGITEFKMVPYALHAKTVEDAATKEYVDALLIQLGEVNKLLNAGFSVEQLYNGGHSVVSLLEAGATVSDLLSIDVNFIVLFKAGVGVEVLLRNGITEEDLANAGLIGTLNDIDGNNYKWVKIGEQVWMAENLKTTKFHDGSNISLVTDNSVWNDLGTPAFCWYNNDLSVYGNIYGALYNWYTVNTKKLCPVGWHAPSDEEWTTLTDYLGGNYVAGEKLKETGTIHWNKPNTNATNQSGFAALPSGQRSSSYDGGFYHIGKNGVWWCSTESSLPSAFLRAMGNASSGVTRMAYKKENGYSVRCIKD